nr:hypothetical protein [Streptococcus sp. S784/96/1]
MAPTTMMIEGRRRVKTDKKDAATIAKALAFRSYSPVHIPSAEDEQVKKVYPNEDRPSIVSQENQATDFSLLSSP